VHVNMGVERTLYSEMVLFNLIYKNYKP